MSDELLIRTSTLAEVDTRLRLVDIIAVPYDQEADVQWRGEEWREVFDRGSFAGIEEHAGRVRVNREHVKGDTVGKVVTFDPYHDNGLLARVKIAATPRGDETLALADEGMISGSVGYRIRQPSDVQLNRRTKTRRVMKAFLDHLGMVESPVYAGAEVLAVREDGTPDPRPAAPTPTLDALRDDEVWEWATDRLNHRKADP